MNIDPTFGFEVPREAPGIPANLLDPRSTWADSARYDEKARQLAGMFKKNFEQFSEGTSPGIVAAGPE
jgi:phosphoenolpyruvate carboxykinase (ATP)